MSDKKTIVKCCVCGREKSRDGWAYCFRAEDPNVQFTHTVCDVCYATEMMRTKMQTAEPEPAFALER